MVFIPIVHVLTSIGLLYSCERRAKLVIMWCADVAFWKRLRNQILEVLHDVVPQKSCPAVSHTQ